MEWFRQWDFNVPTQAAPAAPSDVYVRYCWYQYQAANAASPGASMIWTSFDNDMHNAINAKQTLQLAFLEYFGDQAPMVGGARLVYPGPLHTLLQASSFPDRIDGGYWRPGYENSFLYWQLMEIWQAFQAMGVAIV